jgi:hypothetical protein
MAFASAVTVKIKASISRRVSPPSIPAPEQTAAPSVSPVTAIAYLSDALDCMNPYWDESAESMFYDDAPAPEQPNLSLHL